MHFEFLVEDASGKIVLESLVEKILGPNGTEHTFKITPYKGVGRIPRKIHRAIDARTRTLLNNLPKMLRAYGKEHQYIDAAVVVVVDLDMRDCSEFKRELLDTLASCSPAPKALFRIAIEEMEAWLLGDKGAVLSAYPKAKQRVLNGYVHDSICGTWEVLADAVHHGGAAALKKERWPAPGRAKCEWAGQIAPHLDIDSNMSRSFQVFRDGVRSLCGETDDS